MLRTVVSASAALALSLAPIAAQAAPQPAPRVGVEAGESEHLVGTTMWIVAAVVLGLAIWGVIELTDDNETVSPD